MSKTVHELHPDIDQGWAWAVLFGSFLTHFMTYGVAWSTGVYNVVFLEVFGEAKSVTAWAGAMPTAVMYAIGPISSMFTNKFGCRTMVVIGGFVSSVGLTISYFAPNLYYLYFSFGILAGAGFGLSYIPAITAITYYFDKKLSFATGISCSGIGVGNFLYPALIRWLISLYDWRQSFLILGAITLNVCVCGSLIRHLKRVDICIENRHILDLSPFKKKGYAALCVNNFFFCCGISVIYIHLVAYGESEGLSPDKSAWLISAIGVSNLVGRVAYGIVDEMPRMNTIILYLTSFCLCGVCIMIVPFFSAFLPLLVIAVCFGFFSGCFGTLMVPILIQLLGLQRFANGYGCVLLFEAAGQFIGGPLSGGLFDVTGNYAAAFYTGGAMAIASGLIMIYPYVYVKQRQNREENIKKVGVAATEKEMLPLH